jgi:hypothetical protein
VLFDTGSDKPLIHSRCLPQKGIQPNLDRSIHVSTLVGDKKANRPVVLQGITLPEPQRPKESIGVHVLCYDNESAYDTIVGEKPYYL